MTYTPPEFVKAPIDEIMADVWAVRDELARKYGDVHGLATYLEQRQATLSGARVRKPPSTQALRSEQK